MTASRPTIERAAWGPQGPQRQVLQVEECPCHAIGGGSERRIEGHRDLLRSASTMRRSALRSNTRLAAGLFMLPAPPVAVERFLEFFATSRTGGRGRPYGRAVGRFLSWCAACGLGLRPIAPLHVAAYLRTHPGSPPTVKQHLAAIRVLCDWRVHQVLPVNPAAAVRGPKHWTEARGDQAGDAGTDAGRDAIAARQGSIRGQRHDVPARHRAEAAIQAYLVAGGIEDAKAPLFQSVDRSRCLSGRPLARRGGAVDDQAPWGGRGVCRRRRAATRSGRRASRRICRTGGRSTTRNRLPCTHRRGRRSCTIGRRTRSRSIEIERIVI